MQTLNLPGADRPGSAGRALPHARLRVAADGELLIAGSLFSGYLGDADAGARRGGPPATWAASTTTASCTCWAARRTC